MSSQHNRGQLSLNGGKKKNHYVSASQPQFIVSDKDYNGKNSQKAKPTQSSKSEKNGNGHKLLDDVIIIDEDDIPLARQILIEKEVSPVKVKSPEKNAVVATENKTPKKSLSEELIPAITERESTPKKNKSRPNEKSPRPDKQVEVSVEMLPAMLEPTVEDAAILSAVFAQDICFDEEKEPKQTKVVKLTADLLSSATSGSTRRSDRLVNASTIVNLSTISDQSSKTVDETSETNYNVSSNKISGRRSTRPMKDICFTYRSNSPNDSLCSSVNATIGSEIHNSVLATPAGLKRQIGSTESIDSPKRARLNFSGFFSSISSPVTLLRNKFKNAQIQSSTPNVEFKVDEFQDVPLNISTEPTESPAAEELKETEIVEIEGEHEVAQELKEENPKRRCVIM